MGKRNLNTAILILAFALCLGSASCVHRPVNQAAIGGDLFWPNPPEVKRIQFVNAVHDPGDLNIRPGLLKKVFRYIGGTTGTAIVSPRGLTLDAEGRLYVVDAFLHRVHVFDAAGNRYFIFPSKGSELISPVDVAVDDGSGRIFVTDSKQGGVYIFSDLGRKSETAFGREIFKRPTGIAVNRKTGELLVVDTLLSRVFRFDLGSLAPRGSFGGNGTGEGLFHYPTLISVTPAGEIIISDSLNFRVQVFSPEGRFLYGIGAEGTTPGTFSRPKGVASDSDGNIYVVDALFDNIQVFDNRGRLLMAFGEHGSDAGAFGLPTGICIDDNDTIYVSDSSNQRIQVFKYLKEDIAK